MRRLFSGVILATINTNYNFMLRIFTLAFCCISLMGLSLSAQQSDVIMQGFYWNSNPGDITSDEGVWWDTLANAAPELGAAGFRTVWTPPANKGFAGVYDMGYGLYDYYDFGSFDQKGTVRTRHGNAAQLQAMVDALHGQGLKVMADIVLNHRAGAEDQQPEDCNDGNGQQLRYTKFRPASNRLPMDALHFHPNALHCDLNGPYHDRTFFEDVCYFNLLDQQLDPNQPNGGWYFGPHNLGQAGDSLIAWGRYLLDEVGFDEVRLDAVKHVEPGFMAPFLVELSNGQQPFAVGEFFDGNLSALKNYHDQVEGFVSNYGTGSRDANMALFDFNLRYALRDFANNGSGSYDMWNLNFSGLRLGANLPGEDIVTFVENHDVDRIGWEVTDCNSPDVAARMGNTCLKLTTDSGHDPIFRDKHMAYAYIMAAEGRPSVFWKDWYWYGLDEEIKWQMALRQSMAGGGSAGIQSLNPYFTVGHGGDLFVLNRYGYGTQDGAVLTLNDHPDYEPAAYVNTPFQNMELKDYSDAFLFSQTTAFGDSRALVKAGRRNYAWYAPTGQYPQTPGETPSAFDLGAHRGAKLHFVTLRAADAAQFMVNGAPIQPGDQIAILPAGSDVAVGLGRIGQSFGWDGQHDMIIEVLGGGNAGEAKGGLVSGQSYRLAVYDQSEGSLHIAASFTLASAGTAFDFSARRPASRGGSAPFGLSVTHGSPTYAVGGISLITAFEVTDEVPPMAVCRDIMVSLDAAGMAGITAEDVDGGSSDASGISSRSIDRSTFGCSDTGDNPVVLTVTDNNGNSSSCTATVTVQDTSPPQLSCTDQTITFNGESSIALNAEALADATDNCSAGLSISPMAIGCGAVGSTVAVAVTATDLSGNSSACTALVTVEGLPCGYRTTDDGINCTGGSATSYDPQTRTFELTSDGCYYAPGSNTERMAYTSTEMCGNGDFIAQVQGISGGYGWAGITLRASDAPGAKMVKLMVNNSYFARREYRSQNNGPVVMQQIGNSYRYWLRLRRQGSQVIMYTSYNGSQWNYAGAATVSLPDCVRAGLVVTNYSSSNTITATFGNVSVGGSAVRPAAGIEGPTAATAMEVYPNPTGGPVTVGLPAGRDWSGTRLVVLDAYGRRVRTVAHLQPQQQLELGDLPAGIYFLQLLDAAEGLLQTERLILQ